MHRCLNCKENCLKDSYQLEVKSKSDVQKIYDKFNELFIENTKWAFFNRKLKRQEKCVFSGESQYDIMEIKRMYNEVFDGDDKFKVIFIDGKLGSGKSYKTDKVIKLYQMNQLKIEVQKFDSFQTGFSDNFLYILFLELQSKKNIRKHLRIVKYNVTSIRRFALTIPYALILTMFLYNLLTVFDYEQLITNGIWIKESFTHNELYSLLILISILMINTTLPYVLTLKKEYAINNRAYYNGLTRELLGDVLIIDDYERLNDQQRRQIYEFIDYLRLNSKTIKRLIILGDLSTVEAIEKSELTNNVEVTETFISKYYDKRIILEEWINTFEDVYNSDSKRPRLNKAEFDEIKNFLNHYKGQFSRRSLAKFMTNTNFEYSIKSFEDYLISELLSTRKEEYWTRTKVNLNTYIEECKTPYDKILSLILNEIPYYQTYYYKNGNKIKNPQIESWCNQLKSSKIEHLDLLLEKIIERGKSANELIDIFSSPELTLEYENADFYMFDGENFKYKLNLDYSLYEFFHDNKNVINIGASNTQILEVLDKMITDSGTNLLIEVSNDCEKENYKFSKENYLLTIQLGQLVQDNIRYNHLTDEQIDTAIVRLSESLNQYNKNFVFNMINKFDDHFNIP